MKHLLSFLFPPFCLYCHQPLNPSFSTLCEECFQELKPIDSTNRCYRCFQEISNKKHRCPKHLSSLTATSCCIEENPILHAVHSIQTMAALMIYQWYHLRWPMPDLIIPTPSDWFDRGNHTKNLAKAFASHASLPFSAALSISRGRTQIPYLSLDQQPNTTKCVHIRKPNDIVNKRILLIHDHLQTGFAIGLSARALREGGALTIHALCASIK